MKSLLCSFIIFVALLLGTPTYADDAQLDAFLSDKKYPCAASGWGNECIMQAALDALSKTGIEDNPLISAHVSKYIIVFGTAAQKKQLLEVFKAQHAFDPASASNVGDEKKPLDARLELLHAKMLLAVDTGRTADAAKFWQKILKEKNLFPERWVPADLAIAYLVDRDRIDEAFAFFETVKDIPFSTMHVHEQLSVFGGIARLMKKLVDKHDWEKARMLARDADAGPFKQVMSFGDDVVADPSVYHISLNDTPIAQQPTMYTRLHATPYKSNAALNELRDAVHAKNNAKVLQMLNISRTEGYLRMPYLAMAMDEFQDEADKNLLWQLYSKDCMTVSKANMSLAYAYCAAMTEGVDYYRFGWTTGLFLLPEAEALKPKP